MSLGEEVRLIDATPRFYFLFAECHEFGVTAGKVDAKPNLAAGPNDRSCRSRDQILPLEADAPHVRSEDGAHALQQVHCFHQLEGAIAKAPVLNRLERDADSCHAVGRRGCVVGEQDLCHVGIRVTVMGLARGRGRAPARAAAPPIL